MTWSSDASTERLPASPGTGPQPTKEYVWPEPLPEPPASPTAPEPSRMGSVQAEPEHSPEPRRKGNRLAGIALALLGTAVFAALLLVVLTALRLLADPDAGDAYPAALAIAQTPGFLLPTAVFFVGLALIVLVVNRAGWWAYVLGGFPLALLVAAGAAVGAWIDSSGLRYPTDRAEILAFVGTLTVGPAVLAAAVIAREASVWTGALIAARARSVKRRNAERAAAVPS